MSVTQTLLDNRFSILHIERTSNFSKVLFALDTYQNPPRYCAIKAYNPITQKPQIENWIAEEFQKEASHLKQLSLIERNLPEIYTYFYDSQAYYIVRELVEGLTLREQVQTTGLFSTKMVREILVKLLLVLDYLHKEGVIHQNIKPKNIILRNSDHAPISINFGSIEQIVATFNFHGDKKIFSLNDVRGYTPSEQALGKAIPASDLYSLGLTAIYLLTAKDPVDLPVTLDSGNYQIPSEIKHLDSDLAQIIARAIQLNPSDRYSSAQEMLNSLLPIDSQTFLAQNEEAVFFNGNNGKPKKEHLISTGFIPKSQKIEPNKIKPSKTKFDWVIVLILLAGGLYLLNLGFSAWYTWHLSQDTFKLQVPDSPLSLPTILSKPPEKPSAKKPSMLNQKAQNVLEVPIFTTGTPKKELRKALGEPNAIQKGYWANSSAWIYNDLANGSIDLGYLFDLDTDRLRQTEIAIAPAVGLATINEILDSLLQGNLNNSITQQLQKIYEGQAKTYSFKLGNLEGSIERDKDDNIYIGVWQADFH